MQALRLAPKPVKSGWVDGCALASGQVEVSA